MSIIFWVSTFPHLNSIWVKKCSIFWIISIWITDYSNFGLQFGLPPGRWHVWITISWINFLSSNLKKSASTLPFFGIPPIHLVSTLHPRQSRDQILEVSPTTRGTRFDDNDIEVRIYRLDGEVFCVFQYVSHKVYIQGVN